MQLIAADMLYLGNGNWPYFKHTSYSYETSAQGKEEMGKKGKMTGVSKWCNLEREGKHPVSTSDGGGLGGKVDGEELGG